MSGGSSSSAQSTSQTDNRRVYGNGSMVAEGGSSITNITQTLDGGAIHDAFGFGTHALDINYGVTHDAFGFGTTALADVLGSNDKTITKAFNFGSDALGLAGDALTSNNRALTGAFNFGSDALAGAFTFGNKTVTSALNASSAAFSDALSFAQNSANNSARANSEALNVAAGSLSSALAFGGRQTAVAMDSLTNSANLVKDAYADAKGRGALTDKILMVAIAMAGVVAFMAVKGK